MLSGACEGDAKEEPVAASEPDGDPAVEPVGDGAGEGSSEGQDPERGASEDVVAASGESEDEVDAADPIDGDPDGAAAASDSDGESEKDGMATDAAAPMDAIVDGTGAGEVDAEPAGTACVNAEDLLLLQEWGDPFHPIEKCWVGCLELGLPCYQACIEDQGLSPDCAACSTGAVQCLYDHCMASCIVPSSTKCAGCLVDTCLPGWLHCGGLSEEVIEAGE